METSRVAISFSIEVGCDRLSHLILFVRIGNTYIPTLKICKIHQPQHFDIIAFIETCNRHKNIILFFDCANICLSIKKWSNLFQSKNTNNWSNKRIQDHWIVGQAAQWLDNYYVIWFKFLLFFQLHVAYVFLFLQLNTVNWFVVVE